MTIDILNSETYVTPDGDVVETHSRPTKPAPDGRFDSPDWGWHSVKCEWVPIAEIDNPCEWELKEG